MDQQTVRKTCTDKLQPTAEQERELERVLWRCRTLSNTAREQRITAWQCCHVWVSRSEQEAELKDLRAAVADYAALHRHLRQDVLARLDTTSQAFLRRVQRGQRAGFARCQGRERFPSCPDQEEGNGARLDHGVLVLAKLGRAAVRWSRPLEGTSKTGTIRREADGW